MSKPSDENERRQPDETADQRHTVLHVFDHSFPIGDGYANRSGEILRFLRRAGWHTLQVTSAKQGPTSGPSETARGLEFLRTPPSNRPWAKLPVLDQWAVVTGLRKRVREILKSTRPALVHVHSPCLNAIAALPPAHQRSLAVVYEVRALWEDGAVDSGRAQEGDLRYRVSRALETYACRKADHVVTICEGLRDEMISRGISKTKITVVPNSVDLDRFGTIAPRNHELADRLGLTPGKTLGFIGTFFPFEGLEVLLRAVPAIRSAEPKARFLLIGDGPDSGRIRNLARQLAIEDAVIFTGRVPHEEVERYYSVIDVFVYPRVSNRITELVTPLKPLEAMAQGKLVVASNVGGHREMVFPGYNGVLFTAGSPESLASECGKLFAAEPDWPSITANARSYVATKRSWKKTVQIYDQLYRSLASQTH